jgi:hypothetical protein
LSSLISLRLSPPYKTRQIRQLRLKRLILKMKLMSGMPIFPTSYLTNGDQKSDIPSGQRGSTNRWLERCGSDDLASADSCGDEGQSRPSQGKRAFPGRKQ